MAASGQRHVALLRGVNVGGKNLLSMKVLAEIFAASGCTDVKTHLQSGNVVLRARAATARRLPAAVSAAIEARTGLSVRVVQRTADELLEVARAHPLAKKGDDPRTLHVAFLAAVPAPAAAAALDPSRSPGDTFLVRGREVFLRLPGGVGKSKLTNDYLDRTLGTFSTVRGWNTVQALAALLG